MSPVSFFLLAIAGIFLIGAFGEIVFRRTNIPDVLWLLLVGIVLGPVTHAVPREPLASIAPYFGALALVVVLFEGGSRIRLTDLGQAAPRAAALAAATFAASVVLVALASKAVAALGWLPQPWTWTHALLLGTVLGGSSSIIVMPAMAQARVDARLANIIGLESGFTDVLCVVGASTLMDLMLQGPAGGSAGLALLKSFGLGIAGGAGAGLAWLFLLRVLHDSEHAYPITLAALLGLYVIFDGTGGSAALGVLTFAVVVGNAPWIAGKLGLKHGPELRPDVRGVHSQITFIIKSFFFTFIGCMLGPPWPYLAMGFLLGLLLLAARIPGVWAATYGSDLTRPEKELITSALPRGMAAGVLAGMPAAAGIPGTETMPAMVFACVLTTVLLFTAGFPLARRRNRAPTPPLRWESDRPTETRIRQGRASGPFES